MGFSSKSRKRRTRRSKNTMRRKEKKLDGLKKKMATFRKLECKLGSAEGLKKNSSTHRARSYVIGIENVVPGANSFASIHPITFPLPSPFPSGPRVFDICLLLPRHETGYRRRGGTRVLLDGISNCNDSLSPCFSYCFPVCFPGETKLHWHEARRRRVSSKAWKKRLPPHPLA